MSKYKHSKMQKALFDFKTIYKTDVNIYRTLK
jgi:hypothetical protein